MNDKWLFLGFILLIILGLVVACYPLRRSKKLILTLTPVFMVSASAGYWHWGAWEDWDAFKQQQVKQQQVKAVLATIKSPDELIDKLKKRLDDSPESAHGWYLLGRLYASQNQWRQARDAFNKSRNLKPDEQTEVNYLQSLWQINNQQFDGEIRTILQGLLQKNPQQPDALALLAMNAYLEKDYKTAIQNWQQLLDMAPEQSEEAQSLHKAIVKARQLYKSTQTPLSHPQGQ